MSLRGNEEIRAFVDKLSATNVPDYVDLPMIAVMGETSSGKSALLSSISGVELPSASELTTSCPIKLQMKRAEKKHATVTVQWKESLVGEIRKGEAFADKTVTEEDWRNLPNVILEAQQHIINDTGKEVSRHVVCVKVEGPLCEDLTLIDLPGIVRTRGKDEGESIVEDIDELIKEYLRNKRCIILAVVPANVDFHNSQIMADAQMVDPETKRTIPVITKPDLIDKGGEGDVMELLLGKKTKSFEMGFHMAKGRGQHDLQQGKSIEEGLKDELEFFQKIEPWSKISNRGLFGIESLRRKLGNLFMNLIRKTVPDIIHEMRQKLKETNDQLEEMGNLHKSTAEKNLFYREVLDEIVFDTEATLSGSLGRRRKNAKSTEAPMSAEFHKKCDLFKASLNEGRLANIKAISNRSEVLAVVGSETVKGTVVGGNETTGFHVDYEDRRKTQRSQFVYQQNVPDESKREEGTTWDSPNNGTFICLSNGDGTFDELMPIPATNVRRDPQWILPFIEKYRPDELSVFMNRDVFEKIVRSYIDEDWSGHCEYLVKETASLLTQACQRALASCKKLNRYPDLFSFLQRTLAERINSSSERLLLKVNHVIDKESIPYTQDHYLHENLSKERFATLKQELITALDLLNDPNGRTTNQSILTTINALFDKNGRKSIEEHMAEDMQNALAAYGKVATKRVMDNVPMECWDTLREFPRDDLESGLRSVSELDLDRLLTDSPEAYNRYEELRQKAKAMQKGMKVLGSL